MLGDAPEDRDGCMMKNAELEDWLPVMTDDSDREFAEASLRRWRGLAFAFVLGCGVGALVFALVGHGHVSTGQATPSSQFVGTANAANDASNSDNTGISQIEVDVHGDVRHPGVYPLPFDARVEDAVKAAGGYLHAADAQNVNAAAQLTDGAEVDIPGPSLPNSAVSSASSGSSDGSNGARPKGVQTNRVDLNTADLATLETLPEIGPARAAAIITYRSQHGPFANVSDLTNVSGIGQGILSRIAPYLYVASRND